MKPVEQLAALGMGFPNRNPATIGGHIRGMRIRFSILLSAALLVAAILLVFRDDLHAHGRGETVRILGRYGGRDVLPMSEKQPQLRVRRESR